MSPKDIRLPQRLMTLQLAIQVCFNGKWRSLTSNLSTHTPEAKGVLMSLYSVRNELAVTLEGCLLRGTHLVITQALALRAVQLAHVGHQGIVNTKSRLQCKIQFPGLVDKVEYTTRRCPHCQESSSPNPHPVSKFPSNYGCKCVQINLMDD